MFLARVEPDRSSSRPTRAEPPTRIVLLDSSFISPFSLRRSPCWPRESSGCFLFLLLLPLSSSLFERQLMQSAVSYHLDSDTRLLLFSFFLATAATTRFESKSPPRRPLEGDLLSHPSNFRWRWTDFDRQGFSIDNPSVEFLSSTRIYTLVRLKLEYSRFRIREKSISECVYRVMQRGIRFEAADDGSRKFAFDDGEDQWPLIGSCKFRPSLKPSLFSSVARSERGILGSRVIAPFDNRAELTTTLRSLNNQTSGCTDD